MSKIIVDTDKISNSLLSIANTNKKFIDSTKSIANGVYMPNGETYWNDVVSKLEDCQNQINNYITWVNDLNHSFINNVNDGLDSINGVDIVKVSSSTIIVK